MQRVRIGLTGLAAVFLVVIIAAALLGLVSHEGAVKTDATGNVVEVNMAAADNGADTGQPKEPLAELGVTPGGSPGPVANTTAPAPAAPVPSDR